MADGMPNRDQVLSAIRDASSALGRVPSRADFIARTGITEYQVTQHFASWLDAVRAAGFEPDPGNIKIDDESLLKDWANLVRRNRQVPTIVQYRREGKYSPKTFERAFGPWSKIPEKFRLFAAADPGWADVVALLPVPAAITADPEPILAVDLVEAKEAGLVRQRHMKLNGRPTYGNPIDFRGLRHEPVNEQGVVFLFGMVARELGYSIEAVQSGFPDCEAKRQVDAGKWQRVRIEFEFESRNFREHGHDAHGCDVIVCWRHNWPECPPNLEVMALADVLGTLSKSQD